jgi:hypothetical protein
MKPIFKFRDSNPMWCPCPTSNFCLFSKTMCVSELKPIVG